MHVIYIVFFSSCRAYVCFKICLHVHVHKVKARALNKCLKMFLEFVFLYFFSIYSSICISLCARIIFSSVIITRSLSQASCCVYILCIARFTFSVYDEITNTHTHTQKIELRAHSRSRREPCVCVCVAHTQLIKYFRARTNNIANPRPCVSRTAPNTHTQKMSTLSLGSRTR